MIYPLAIILILMAGAAGAAVLIVAAWDAELSPVPVGQVRHRQLAASFVQANFVRQANFAFASEPISASTLGR